MDEELSIEAFRSWLEGRVGDEFPLVSPCSESCPLARWLRDTRGGPWYVGLAGYGYGEWYASLPEWGCRFVDAFDHRYGDDEAVTGAQVLEVLNEVAPH
jgi:hypothetical protein